MQLAQYYFLNVMLYQYDFVIYYYTSDISVSVVKLKLIASFGSEFNLRMSQTLQWFCPIKKSILLCYLTIALTIYYLIIAMEIIKL